MTKGKVKYHTCITKQDFEQLNYNQKQELITRIKKDFNIQYGILFDNGQVIPQESAKALQLELSTRSMFGGSVGVMAVIQ